MIPLNFIRKSISGDMVELANYKNKTFVLLDFWASWCMPCLKEIPKMKEVYKKYNEKGLTIIGISLDRVKDSWSEAIRKYNLNVWPQILSSETNEKDEKENNLSYLYNCDAIPFYVLIDKEGKILVNEEGFLKLAADGHGGVFESMLKSGALEDMNKRNIEWVFIGPVDNPLVNMVDPIFVAIAATKKCMAAGKSVVKARPEERVGVFCKRNSKPSVVEYTEISEEMSTKRDANGELVFGESHINCNLFNIRRINEIPANKLPYHEAFKKANYINAKGELVVANKPNAYKFETFIFDAFQSMESMAVMRVKREDEFAPVKNAEGVDSPETARKLYKEFHKIK